MVRNLRLWVVALFVSVATLLSAQVTTSSMSGKVTDNSREPLIGATVLVTHTPTGTTYGASTRVDGSFNILNMRVGGPYTVEISYIGFHTETLGGVNLTLGEDFVLNTVLKEDSKLLDEVVIVGDGSASAFSSSRTGAQEIITREKMEKLPTITRSLNDFTRLTPMSSGGNFGGASYRFNNVTVDGASFNNSFGLSSSLGAAGVEPISLEALDQVQVMIAPYDVRNGGFTGAGINSVTKSGTNKFQASAYMYVRSPEMMGYRIKDEILSVTEFSNKQYGISLSGPIVKNKLFFYLNAELDRQETPITYTTKNSAVDAAVMDDIANFLNAQFDYNPGAYDLTKRNTQADRLTARLDWNINPKNSLSLKYYYLKSFNTNNPSGSNAPLNGRGPNQYAIPFTSMFYRTNNNFNIIIADLSTKINDNVSNYLKLGYSALRDFRDMDGGFFPQVDILNGKLDDLMAYTSFGTEPYSYNNQLSTDVFQIQNNVVWNIDRHQITFGTQSDYRAFKNGFAPNYLGSWVFASVDDFKFNVLATKDYLNSHGGSIAGFNINNYNPADYGLNPINGGLANSSSTGATSYQQRYAIGGEFPFAKINVMQLGFYLQDKWNINDQLNLTYGLRADIPIFMTDLPENERVASETYRDGIKIDVSKYPNTKVLLSPKLGFNYKPLDDNSLQFRGGTGLFSGTPPYVWLSNQASNNGVLFGDVEIKGAELATLGFTGNAEDYRPAAGTPTRGDIAVTDPNFKYPTLWKSNVAVDYRFLDGWIATAEFLYSKDINAIYHDNIGQFLTTNFVKDGSGQQVRPLYSGFYSNQPGNVGAANRVIMLRNTDKGYSWFTTLQLQKEFSKGLFKGLYLNGSYTFGKSKSVTDGTSSQAHSAWRYRPALDPNAQELGYSAGSFDGRLLLSASYTADWGKNASSSIGLVFQRYRPFRYSYTYNGDANGDGYRENDLIYIPNSLAEIKDHLDPAGFDSQEAAWAALDSFIEQDPYLSKNRGKFAERNGAVAPFANQLDLSLSHDIRIYQPNNYFHTLRFSFNIQNFLNLLNKDWGVKQTTILGYQQYQFLRITQTPKEENNYTIKYSMNKDLTETFQDDISNSSRWQMQFGIKYIF